MKRTGTGLTAAGTLGLIVALGLVHSRIATNPYSYGGSRLWWAVGFAGALSVASYALGVPDVPRNRRQAVSASAAAAMFGLLAVATAQATVGGQVLPRFVVLGGTLVSAAWFMSTTAASISVRRRAERDDRILLIADAESEARLRSELIDLSHPPMLAAAFRTEAARPHAADAAPLVAAACDVEATVVVLDRDAQSDQSIVDQVALLHERGVRVRTVSLFYEQWLLRLPVAELERVSLMFDIGEVHRARYGRRKRLVDIGAALCGLPLLLAAIPLVFVGNIVANRGPLFFRQDRVGKHGAVFRITKFRTMNGAEGAGAWTAESDPRITRFGRFLRRTHIDELPQMLDVLRGSLSIVGPRPEQPHYVEELVGKLPFYDLRHLVQPGVTGWAQINQGYASSHADALEKLQFEFWYLRHQSLLLDFRILARTVRSVIGGDGR